MANNPSTIKVTPTIESLLRGTNIRCPLNNCAATFKNNGQFILHVNKHHHSSIFKLQSNNGTTYHCPIEICKYNTIYNDAHFKSIQFLRQHFLKVHANKTEQCGRCSKRFSTQTLRNIHERACGTVYHCTNCDFQYTLRESMVTHCKRKNHYCPEITLKKLKANKVVLKEVIDTKLSNNSKVKILRLKPTRIDTNPKLPNTIDKHSNEKPPTVTSPKAIEKNVYLFDNESNNFVSNSSQTLPSVWNFDEDDTISYFKGPRHIETQTEFTELFDNTSGSDGNLDQVFNDVYTQTGDDFFELGFTNIETQTNWPAEMFNTDLPEVSSISTETQTNFSTHFSNDIHRFDTHQSSIHTQTYFSNSQQTHGSSSIQTQTSLFD